jgi:predicted NAD/FAD-binding protein
VRLAKPAKLIRKQLMPRRKACWAAWNYVTTSEEANVNALTYWMNIVQDIPEEEFGNVFVTVNPPFRPDPSKTFATYSYMHPFMSRKSIEGQRKLPLIQNKRGISFAGACASFGLLSHGLRSVGTNYGFHEDGFVAGIQAALHLPGVSPPFDVAEIDRPLEKLGKAHSLFWTVLQHIFVAFGFFGLAMFAGRPKQV